MKKLITTVSTEGKTEDQVKEEVWNNYQEAVALEEEMKAKMVSNPAILTSISDYQANMDKYLDCAVCGWGGAVKDAENEATDVLFEVRCPNCDKMLMVAGS